MRHEIKIEKYTRDADGKVFVRVIMNELAGADAFRIVARGDDIEPALVELAARLQLVADDANDIAEKILDRYPQSEDEENAHSSAREDQPIMLVVHEREVE